MQIDLHSLWPAYKLIDSGDGAKLEKFGDYSLIRPEPLAKHKPALSRKEWELIAHGEFIQESRTKGQWRMIKPFPARWNMPLSIGDLHLNIELRRSGFKHIGVFPEQILNWRFIRDAAREKEGAKLLNLFGYTGVMSLVAAAAGCRVTHVEALKQLNQWGKENMLANNLDGIRWIADDVVKFCEKEGRRGNTYDFVVLDPPAFGLGKNGKTWRLQRDLLPLMQQITRLLKPGAHVVLSMYAQNVDPDKLCREIEQSTPLCLHDKQVVEGTSDHGTTVNHGYIFRFSAQTEPS